MSRCTDGEALLDEAVAAVIARFRPHTVDERAACFARDVVARARPPTPARARALLFATSRLAAFCETVGVELVPEVVLTSSVIERFATPGVVAMSEATRRTVRSNLRAVARVVLVPTATPVPLPRERAKTPYTETEIASYLALCDAQPTEARRHRARALLCLGAGAGLVGGDLRGVRGTDVVRRSGGVVVTVGAGRRPRVVPVLTAYHERLLAAAHFAGPEFVIGGVDPARKNVTTPLLRSLSGGRDLPRISLPRLRATWLVTLAAEIGLRAFLDAAGITCSQRLGDLVAHLEAVDEPDAVSLLGGGR